MDDNRPETVSSSSSHAGSKLLAKFSDADGLFHRPPVAAEIKPPPAIPLKRFQELEQAIRHSPASPEPYVELGRIYLDQKRWTDAKRVLDGGVLNCADCEPLLLMREDLTLLLASQMVDDAKTRHAQDRSEQTQYDLEQSEINLANERIRICASRYARHPDQKDILITWAVALRQLARHEEGVELLTQAAQEPSLRARASLQLGICLQTLRRPLEALSAFRKAALFRSPAPDPAIRIRALELATMIAEEHQLIDSARFYAEKLLESVDASRKSEVEQLCRNLQSREL